ncbi:MAG: tetratricopeptide repeat protein [Candidatus Methylumidiphilus sp.]
MGLFDWFDKRNKEAQKIPEEIKAQLNLLRQADPEFQSLSDKQLMLLIQQAMEMEATQANVPDKASIERLSAEECGAIGNQLLELGRWQEAESWIINALEKSENTRDYLNQCRAYTLLGSLCYRRGEFPKAMKLLKYALELSEQFGLRREKGMIYDEIGTAYNTQGQYADSIECHKMSISIIEELDENACVAYGNLGKSLFAYGDIQRATEAYEQALILNLKIGRENGAAIQYGNLGAIFAQQGLLDRAQEMFRKALAIHEKLGDQESMARQYYNLGTSYGEQGKLDQAIKTLNNALEINAKIGNESVVAQIYCTLATFYNIKGDIAYTLDFYNKSLNIAGRIGDNKTSATTYFNLGILHRDDIGDANQARQHFEKAKALFEMLGLSEDAQRVARELRSL